MYCVLFVVICVYIIIYTHRIHVASYIGDIFYILPVHVREFVFFIVYGIYFIQNYYSIDMAIVSAMNPSLHIMEDDIPPCCCVAGRLVHGLANVRPCMQLGRVKLF